MDRIPSPKAGKRIPMLKKFDSDQLWVALILGLVILCLAVYRMWML
jgi:hypothetical protein